jgi:ABC-type glycerol-3-phosphate transport system substrate-binding protein
MAPVKCGIIASMRMKSMRIQNWFRVAGNLRHPLVWWCGLVLLFVSCSGDQAPTITQNTPTPAVLATPTVIPITTAEVASALPVQRQLVIWTPEFFDASLDNEASRLLQIVYQHFEQENAGVDIDAQVKAEAGEANLFNYLRSAQRVAPTILPDVVLIDTYYLWQLVELGLVEPIALDQLGLTGRFYPFALNAVTFQEQQYGIPYVADVLHAVYATETYTTPITWDQLLTVQQPYHFPAGVRESNYDESLLLQYVGAGGELLENGEISSLQAAEALFSFLGGAKDKGVITDAVLDLSSLKAAWNAFQINPQGMANVSANLYMSQVETQENIRFGPLPTRDGENLTVAHTWAFAILTNDPERRALTLRLLDGFLQPSVHGQWSQLATRLPTTRQAWEGWSGLNSYTEFLQRQLGIAIAVPGGSSFSEFARRLQSMQQAILRGQLSPQAALVQLQAPP